MTYHIELRIEAVDALTVAAHPQAPRLVEQQAVYAVAVVAKTVSVESDVPELVAVGAVIVQALFGPYKYGAVGRFEQTMDEIVAQTEAVVVHPTVHLEVETVKTIEAVVGAKPHEAAPILHHGPHTVVRESVVGLIATVQRRAGDMRQHSIYEECQQQSFHGQIFLTQQIYIVFHKPDTIILQADAIICYKPPTARIVALFSWIIIRRTLTFSYLCNGQQI